MLRLRSHHIPRGAAAARGRARGAGRGAGLAVDVGRVGPNVQRVDLRGPPQGSQRLKGNAISSSKRYLFIHRGERRRVAEDFDLRPLRARARAPRSAGSRAGAPTTAGREWRWGQQLKELLHSG